MNVDESFQWLEKVVESDVRKNLQRRGQRYRPGPDMMAGGKVSRHSFCRKGETGFKAGLRNDVGVILRPRE
jgi:hypothetical protein